MLIVASHRCDKIDVHTNKPKLLKMPCMTYNHAQKMRAAVSHKFGCELALWHMESSHGPKIH